MTTLPTAPDTWIRRYHQAPNGTVQLVCFPHAGGSASFYFPVSTALSPGVEVSAVQYPGRQDRRAEPNIDSLPALADAIFPVVRPLADRPLAFFGHSMGALLAYEVALRLEADGAPPLTRLYVSGRRAPSRYRPDAVHRQGDAGIVAELRRLSATDSELLGDPETLEMILPAIKSDYKAVETYEHTPGQSVSSPIYALIGDDDPKVTAEEANAWAEHTTGSFEMRTFPGGHFYLVDQSAAVIRLIATDLSTSRRS
ncbi:alpha/beta fold hydrolase [Actinomadura sp. DC4]|uniref:thioesterase II family protein n=1 Tax=Actinomadura sp. DC4 TaxID=3055069 RepID=UPI0025B0D6E3|nr:alpha/beta fold hydrolase [Actinomadura sp. DC4]MDN3357935.1 alpha/beta fold hydrolase [Actinomadura sp. DC4]